MTEDIAKVPVPAPSTPTKTKSASPVSDLKKITKKHGISATPPSIADMVNIAIFELNEKGGSSVIAVKKYIASTFKADVKKSAAYIRRYVTSALEKGHLIQTKGGGAVGSFKLSESMKRTAEIASDRIRGKTFVPKKSYPGKPREKSDTPHVTHPSYAEMVDTAIKALNEKRGSSVIAIKKYIAGSYPVNKATYAKFIKKQVIGALASGLYVQTKGSGACGSIKLWDGTNTPVSHTKSKVGRPKLGSEKKRGRPAKTTSNKVVKPKKPSSKTTGDVKKRGRPSKTSTSPTESGPLKKAGRPPTKKSSEKPEETSSDISETTEEKIEEPSNASSDAPVKKAGRPPKTTSKDTSSSTKAPGKGRGRPPKK